MGKQNSAQQSNNSKGWSLHYLLTKTEHMLKEPIFNLCAVLEDIC